MLLEALKLKIKTADRFEVSWGKKLRKRKKENRNVYPNLNLSFSLCYLKLVEVIDNSVCRWPISCLFKWLKNYRNFHFSFLFIADIHRVFINQNKWIWDPHKLYPKAKPIFKKIHLTIFMILSIHSFDIQWPLTSMVT